MLNIDELLQERNKTEKFLKLIGRTSKTQCPRRNLTDIDIIETQDRKNVKMM